MDEGKRNLPTGAAQRVRRRGPTPKAQKAAFMAPKPQGFSQLLSLSWGNGREGSPEANIQKQVLLITSQDRWRQQDPFPSAVSSSFSDL